MKMNWNKIKSNALHYNQINICKLTAPTGHYLIVNNAAETFI